MGETRETDGLSYAPSRRPADRLVAGSDLKRCLSDTGGATMIEYAVIIGVLALGLVATFSQAQSLLLNLITNAIAMIS